MHDLVIIGGGIHGAGVAQAAAASRYSVLLLEQSGIASGTSSRSSKLIHGGLRYLESLELSLVKESLHERRLLLKLAPDLVKLVPFNIPVYKSTRRRPWQIRLGLGLYALLGGLQQDNRFKKIARSHWEGLDGLSTTDLQAVYQYQDGQTDDASLTRAVIRSAQSFGAEIVIPGKFVSANIRPGEIEYEYLMNGQCITGKARVLVNAAGPWVNHVHKQITPHVAGQAIELVRGTHISIAGSIKSGIFYLESPEDGRAVFVMPRDGNILIGTTEELFLDTDPANVKPTEKEQEYLLRVLRYYFPEFTSAGLEIIQSSFAGLRVLPLGKGKAFKRSRETILIADNNNNPRRINIYGGKLTTYRSTAEKVMLRLAASLPETRKFADTRELVLSAE
ncbi:MAG: glycerol-3-phosphate dehydrogenase [Gammaproteobacteria bacterium]|jgi:glycerol-3-phosphate dehydrogenase